MKLNSLTEELQPYPAEALRGLKQELTDARIKVFDFGTGDPRLATWDAIPEALRNNIPEISQYPSVRANQSLSEAQAGYLKTRFALDNLEDLDMLPTRGSKEGIFHIALSLIGRAGGRRSILYPTPGYPVYDSSVRFAGGTPVPYELTEDNRFLVEPWRLSKEQQQDLAAVWINYPHNPTGAMAPLDYLEELGRWSKTNDTLILSDECYVDIYDPKMPTTERPLSMLSVGPDSTLAFFSLSKRSGMTGYRCGFMCGPKSMVAQHARARANFGSATPVFLQAAAAKAWSDEKHVENRRTIFQERLDVGYEALEELGLATIRPRATFYLWARCPAAYENEDVRFAKALSERGLICMPSSWMGNVRGYVRFSMVPSVEETREAMGLLRDVVTAGG